MLEFSFSLDGVPFLATVEPQGQYAPELWGEGRFIFTGELAETLARIVFESYSRDGRVWSEPLGDFHEEATGEEREPGGELVLDVDQGIGAIAYLISLGSEEPIPFRWEGGSSPFWLFHDLSHARFDFSGDAPQGFAYSPPQELTAFEEDRASVQGAILAVESGVPFKSVLLELAKMGKGFADRFGQRSTALADYVDTLPDSLAVQA